MKYIQDLKEGAGVKDVYLCKQKTNATTKNGKEYINVILQDKTGSIDAKIWEPNSFGINDFESHDYIFVSGEVTSFNGTLQVNIKQLRVADEGEFMPKDYFPVSNRDIEEMYAELLKLVDSIENKNLQDLLNSFFREDATFIKAFKECSAAKTVHHGFIGGLLEHTLSVAGLCDFYAKKYPVLKRDLLVTAALCHDIGKVREFVPFPENDYTDEGNLLGHIVMGSEMITEKAAAIDGFSPVLLRELKHCILSHHGKLEYGSPKVPALAEAVALNFADDTDAKLQMFTEIKGKTFDTNWLGYNKFLETNIRMTKGE